MNGTVVILDNEPFFRDFVQELLTKTGYSVFGVPSSSETIRLCEEHEVDVIIVDLLMPDLRGNRIIGEIRGAGILIPVIVISGRERDLELEIMIQDGTISGVLYKPFIIEKLGSLLDAAIIRNADRMFQPGRRTADKQNRALRNPVAGV